MQLGWSSKPEAGLSILAVFLRQISRHRLLAFSSETCCNAHLETCCNALDSWLQEDSPSREIAIIESDSERISLPLSSTGKREGRMAPLLRGGTCRTCSCQQRAPFIGRAQDKPFRNLWFLRVWNCSKHVRGRSCKSSRMLAAAGTQSSVKSN